jgi:hypothetical protein
MVEYYIDLMASSMLAGNDGIGSVEMFEKLILHGFPAGTLQYCSYDVGTVINDYNAFMSWANIPGNIGSELSNCQ